MPGFKPPPEWLETELAEDVLDVEAPKALSPWASLRLQKAGDEFPCEACVRIARLRFLVGRQERAIGTWVNKLKSQLRYAKGKKKRLTIRQKRLLNLNQQLNDATANHPKCSFCLILFGEYHLSRMAEEIDGRPACRSCVKHYQKFGNIEKGGQNGNNNQPKTAQQV